MLGRGPSKSTSKNSGPNDDDILTSFLDLFPRRIIGRMGRKFSLLKCSIKPVDPMHTNQTLRLILALLSVVLALQSESQSWSFRASFLVPWPIHLLLLLAFPSSSSPSVLFVIPSGLHRGGYASWFPFFILKILGERADEADFLSLRGQASLESLLRNIALMARLLAISPFYEYWAKNRGDVTLLCPGVLSL